jgi:aminoglycoside phosphotransferase (APT) family kinase protein
LVAGRSSSEFAREVVRANGAEPLRVAMLVGGEVNHVLAVETSRGGWVVRFARDPRDADQFPKEAYCLGRARRFGLPSPDLIAVGRFEDVPYIIQSRVDGPSGSGRPGLELWATLGRYARTIHEIPLDEEAPDSLFPRFGRQIHENWRRHLDYNLGMLTAEDPLLALRAYSPAQQGPIRDVFAALRSLELPAGLDHGDLVPQNVVLPSHGPPVVFDWGCAGVGPVPHRALLRLWDDHRRTGEPNRSQIGAFAVGLQVDLQATIPVLDDMLVLDRIDRARWALDRRPDRVTETITAVQRIIQARLGG